MIKKLQVILLLISVSVSLGLMSSTYSRYVANTTGNIDALFAKWQILVNTTDVADNTVSSIDFVPVIEESENVASNVVAPGSEGYFDIEINASNTDVSFAYNLVLSINNSEIPDLLITEYAILDSSYVEGDTITTSELSESTISGNMVFDKITEDFSFESFTIRIYFEWYDGIDGSMDDDADTSIGNQAANDEVSLEISADLSFEQIVD